MTLKELKQGLMQRPRYIDYRVATNRIDLFFDYHKLRFDNGVIIIPLRKERITARGQDLLYIINKLALPSNTPVKLEFCHQRYDFSLDNSKYQDGNLNRLKICLDQEELVWQK